MPLRMSGLPSGATNSLPRVATNFDRASPAAQRPKNMTANKTDALLPSLGIIDESLLSSDQSSDFAPGDELDDIFREQPANCLTGENVEVTLTPRGTPGGVISCDCVHLLVHEY